MMQKLKDIVIRALTGAIFVSCIVGSVLLGAYTFFAVFTLIALGAICEYCRLVNKKETCVSFGFSLVGALLLNGSMFTIVEQIEIAPVLVAAYVLFILVMFARELFLPESKVGQIRHFLLGQIAVVFPLSLLLKTAYAFNGTFSKELLLFLLAIIWINDTFAYLTGIFLGRHRMAERISPKKSWEGFAGGLIFSIGLCVAASVYLKAYLPFFETYPWYVWALMVLVVIVFGTMGDFLESLFKRKVGVKDSGRILPGHGGLLDRFDSLLMASPALFVFVEFVNYFLK